MRNYARMYRFGITPWERYGTAAAASIATLLDREEIERSSPLGRALDLGCGDVLDSATETVTYIGPGETVPVAPLQIGFDLKEEPTKARGPGRWRLHKRRRPEGHLL
jgi:hypothetical protein